MIFMQVGQMDTTSWNENTGEPRVWKLTRAVRGRAGGKGPSCRYLACCLSYYDLDEPLPDHSTLSKIRTRYGLEVFRRFFEAIVEQCQQARLVWGKEVYFDATQIEANADLDSLAPRFAVEAREAIQEHLTALFASESPMPEKTEEERLDSSVLEPLPLPTSLSQPQREELAADNATRHDWIAEEGRPQREVHGAYQRTADLRISTTDPDATPMRLKGGGTHLGYHTHYVVDGGKSRIILSVLVVPGEVNDNQPILDLIWRILSHWRIRPSQATGDMMYGTTEIIKALEDARIRAYIPIAERGQRPGYYGSAQFTYDAVHDQLTCPQGHLLRPAYRLEGSQEVQYRADAAVCNACPVKSACTESNRGRHVHRPFLAAYLDRVKAYESTFAYRKALNKRKVWVEPLFGEGKQWHGMRRFRLRRLWRVNCEALMIATGQNLKRLLRKRGWGRRPFPAEAVAVALPLACPPEKPLTNRIRNLRSRKVAVAGMISFGCNNGRSYAQIPCFSLKIPSLNPFLIVFSYRIFCFFPLFLPTKTRIGDFLVHHFP